MNCEHEFARRAGSKDSWRCTRCKIEDTRSEIEFAQDEVKKERERIIKLIKNYDHVCECSFVRVCYTHRLIALIKGENNV